MTTTTITHQLWGQTLARDADRLERFFFPIYPCSTNYLLQIDYVYGQHHLDASNRHQNEEEDNDSGSSRYFFFLFLFYQCLFTHKVHKKKGPGDDDDSLSWAVGEYFHFFFVHFIFSLQTNYRCQLTPPTTTITHPVIMTLLTQSNPRKPTNVVRVWIILTVYVGKNLKISACDVITTGHLRYVVFHTLAEYMLIIKTFSALL